MSSTKSVQCFGKKKTGKESFFSARIARKKKERQQANINRVVSNRRRALQGKPNRTAKPQSKKRASRPTLTLWGTKQQGKGLVKVNGKPLSLAQPEILRFKVNPPTFLLLFPCILFLTLHRRIRSTNRYSSSGWTSSRGWTSACGCEAVATRRRSTPSARPLPSRSWPITKSTWTSTPRTS